MRDFIQQIIKEAGGLALKYYQNGVARQFKNNDYSDVVTEADLTVDKFLVEAVCKQFPEHGIISEEMHEVIRPDAEYVWVIDPIDGTRNFASHIPFWCTMIGITKAGEPYIGAVYDVLHDELYFAEKGQGAFMNGEKITVSGRQEVERCFMVYSSGERIAGSPYYADEYPRYLQFLKNLMGEQGFWVNNFASVLSLCHLARGGIDAFLICSGLYHDYLAGYVIATEAGAKFTDSYGSPWKKGRKDVLVANPILHKKLLELF